MRVIATENGFHGGRRIRKGTTFVVEEGVQGKWFAPLEPGSVTQAREKKARKGKGEAATLSEMGSEAVTSFSDAMAGDA